MSLIEYIPMKYLPLEIVDIVPQFGLHECEKRLEKLPFFIGSTTKISYPNG